VNPVVKSLLTFLQAGSRRRFARAPSSSGATILPVHHKNGCWHSANSGMPTRSLLRWRKCGPCLLPGLDSKPVATMWRWALLRSHLSRQHFPFYVHQNYFHYWLIYCRRNPGYGGFQCSWFSLPWLARSSPLS